MSIKLNRHNVLVIIACLFPIYLIVGGILVFNYLDYHVSSFALIFSSICCGIVTLMNFNAVMRDRT